ncbi:hypothetical protein OSTOST_14510, partial [Ostertagia ostertagi]
NGITIEMYSPKNTAYTLLAAGVVTLKPLLQKAESAQKVLPIEIPFDSGPFEELTVMVHRCTGLDNLKRGELEVCVIYEFFSFSPYFTNYVTSSKTAIQPAIRAGGALEALPRPNLWKRYSTAQTSSHILHIDTLS